MRETKKERLNSLKEQEQFYKVLDKYFDAGWREFVKDIHRKNDLSNMRIFEILRSIKGVDFVKDLIALMTSTKNRHAYLSLTKKPKGILLKDDRFKNIPELMINKYTASAYREGEVFIRINSNRWIKFVF